MSHDDRLLKEVRTQFGKVVVFAKQEDERGLRLEVSAWQKFDSVDGRDSRSILMI
jgi:hypothetical protein